MRRWPTEDTPANHANTSVTGSSPATADATIRTRADAVCTTDAMYGDACLTCERPHPAGRAALFPREKMYRESTLWKDSRAANRLVIRKIWTRSPAIAPT